MQKTAVTVFGALLISGMAVQMAAASERHHHVTQANFSRPSFGLSRSIQSDERPDSMSVSPQVCYHRMTRTLGDLTQLGLVTETRR